MKNLLIILLISSINLVCAQIPSDTKSVKKDYYNLEDALKNPKEVYRLTLDSTAIKIPTATWAKFSNLEFLSLKNDHLKNIPDGIGNLKNLKILDLSGNDFQTLPSSFGRLKNLREIYLNDEKNFQLEKSISMLNKLPNLKTLHLENDNLKQLPKNFFSLKALENLYLNDNHFESVPDRIKELKNLKYLDFHHNDLNPDFNSNSIKIPEPNFGIKIRF